MTLLSLWWQWPILILIVTIIVEAATIIIMIKKHKLNVAKISVLHNMFNDTLMEMKRNLKDRSPYSKSDKKNITEIIKEKKERFSNVTSISFHFVDRSEVKNFYNDTFREPTFESLVSEITGEITGEVKGSLPKIIESKIGGKDINKWISKIKLPDTSLSGMFIKYQKEAIQRGEITIGLEELDVELNELQEFDLAVKNIKENFNFDIEHSNLKTHRSKLKQNAAKNTLTKLETATGWVLIEGKFLISKKDNMYDCSLTHPVNKFLPPDAKEIKIMFSLPIESIESKYESNYKRSVGKMIPTRLLGKVWQPIDRNAGVWELQITPLAVY